MRRVVASPRPKRIFGVESVRVLLEHGGVVICAGGGGIPTIYTEELVPAGRRLTGVEAVIDKDLSSALLAADLHADALLIVTDVDAVYADWGTPQQRAIRTSDARRTRRRAVRRGINGPEGHGGLRVRRADRRPRGDRIDRRCKALLDGTAGTSVTTLLRERAAADAAVK